MFLEYGGNFIHFFQNIFLIFLALFIGHKNWRKGMAIFKPESNGFPCVFILYPALFPSGYFLFC
jgi:hypothetical protein